MSRSNWRPTHRLGYDRGVWIPVQIKGRLAITREGDALPVDKTTLLRPYRANHRIAKRKP